MKNELLAVQAEIRMLDVSDEGEEDRRHVLERCDNIYRRLNAIHSATKESKLTLVPTSLSPMLYEMIGRMSTELSGIRTDIRVIGQIPQVLADREYLEEAIHNLITNAVDVLKEVPEERRSLRVQLQNLDDWVILSVEDTGPGITAGNLKHIFDPFFSSSPISEHWGIGLTMTYRIVKAHSGRITVQTKEGQGTTFQILLPALSGGFMPGHASGSLKESGGPA
ncbi:MAG: HAMP domain-containing histidine kinase, partial [Lachnospiraceae bacterium]|nr:HAMP domain-containing histidine kinase [Lachnospiraceae bacterium]